MAAVYLGTIDLAIGNVFGSNFNIGVLAFDDMFFTKGSLFSFISPNHIIPVMRTTVITSAGIIGFFLKKKKMEPRLRFCNNTPPLFNDDGTALLQKIVLKKECETMV